VLKSLKPIQNLSSGEIIVSAQLEEYQPTTPEQVRGLEVAVALTEAFGESAPPRILRIVEGYGDMPTPVAEPVEATSEKIRGDCPAPKFENGGTRLGHDLKLVPGYVQIDV
jgi:hypothetical protein